MQRGGAVRGRQKSAVAMTVPKCVSVSALWGGWWTTATRGDGVSNGGDDKIARYLGCCRANALGKSENN